MRRLAVLSASLLVPLISACTSILGDFSTGPATKDAASDAPPSDGTQPGDGGSDANTHGIRAVVSGAKVYLGQRATVDGSKSTSTFPGTPTFSWTVLSAPSSSSVTSGSLVGNNTASASFLPDVAGTYELELVFASGIHSAKADATVTAFAPQVFYLEGTTSGEGGLVTPGPDASGSLGYYAVDSTGKNARPVMCPDFLPAGLVGEVGDWGGIAFDTFEGEAGDPPKYAGFTVENDTTAMLGFASHLWSGTSLSSCDAAPPIDLGIFPGTSPSLTGYAMNPRFSPDGSRIAFLDQLANIVTVASNGSGAPTVVAAYDMNAPDGSAGGAFDPSPVGAVLPRPQWFGTSVAWARPTPTGWQIVTAPDMASAPVTVYMNCTSVAPRQFAFLPSGNVIASFRTTTTSPENLYQIDTTCSVVKQYTNLSDTSAAVATDFSVSPDGNTLAFLSLDPAVQDAAPFNYPGQELVGGYLFVGPVDKSSDPVQIGTRAALYGPRWIGGGTLLVFTRLEPLADGGFPATSAVVITPDGGFRQEVASGDGVTTTLSTSGNGACSIGGRAFGPGAFSLMSLAGIVHLLRRRKRRS
jgi:WD40-like Beta Propeller Repeat